MNLDLLNPIGRKKLLLKSVIFNFENQVSEKVRRSSFLVTGTYGSIR